MTEQTATGTVETLDRAVTDNASLVRHWLDAIAIADKEEEAWRKIAHNTIELYRQASPNHGNSESRQDAKDRKFNILHSNIQTILPALYNSTPVPDVRRRFSDDDPIGKGVSDIIERILSHSIDSYDFDATIKRDVFDSEVAGRGLSRVRYKPYVGPDEEVNYEEVTCEHVIWKHFRRGPAYMWEDVPWIAFEHFLTRDELLKLDEKKGALVNLDVTPEHMDKGDGREIPDQFKRARVWEIWDKSTRKVLFIATGYKAEPVRYEDDPLRLQQFFCIPRPLYAVEQSSNLVPVVPYEVYKAQAEELEEVSRRIQVLTEAVKAKALYDSRMTEMDRLADEDDTAHIPIENVAVFADGSKLADHIMFYPIDVITAALEKLYFARDQIKQTIYEITGISDILRGESKASETATAQNIKQQWGSLRIQNKQQEIQRYARDLFRLKSEIVANHFQWETIVMMTGIDFPDQQTLQQAGMAAQQAQMMGQPVPPEVQEVLKKPPREMVEQVLRTDAIRGFRIDVESDSTIRADMTRNQQNMNMFLQGTAQFATAMGPIIMQFPTMGPAVFEVYSAFARNFKLGKQAEDALDGVADHAKGMAQNPQPQENPQLEVEKLKAATEQKKMEMEVGFKREEHGMKMEMMRADLEKKMAELELQREKMSLDMEAHQQKMAMDAESMQIDAIMQERQAAMDMERSEREHAMGLEAGAEKHRMGLEALLAKTNAQKDAARNKQEAV